MSRLTSSARRLAVLALAFASTAISAHAQSKPEFIRFQGARRGALYRPDSGPAPHVGVVVMHPTANYMTHPICTELSRRGVMMLCMTTRFANNEVFVDYEKLPLD